MRPRKDKFPFKRLRSGWSTVSPLELMVSEGLMDHLYGSWCDGDKHPDSFDPDAYSRFILAL